MPDGMSVSGVRVRGPLEEYAAGFAEFLTGQGYTPGSVHLQVQLVSQLSRWLDAEGIDVAGLTDLAAERFIAARRARVRRLFRSRRALAPLIGYLRDLDVLPAPVTVALSAVEELLERYRRYLLVERVLTVESARVYVTVVRPFLESFQIDGGLELGRVTAADVRRVCARGSDAPAGHVDPVGRNRAAIAAGIPARRGRARAVVDRGGAGRRGVAHGRATAAARERRAASAAG